MYKKLKDQVKKKKENKKKRVPLIKWGLSTVQQLHGTQTLFFFN